MTSDLARFLVLAALVSVVALTGGSSRPDTHSLILLRPLAFFFVIYAALVVSRAELRAVRAPLALLGAFAIVALMQVMPFTTYFGAQPAIEATLNDSSKLTTELAVRTISADLDRTWNSLFSLSVPLAAILLVAAQRGNFRDGVVPLLVVIGILSTVFGYLQAIGSNSLYLYAVTHRGFPVGLFANKNHQAVILLWVMLAASWATATYNSRRISGHVMLAGALGIMLVLFPLLILTGSRAALALSPIALVLSGWLLHRSPVTREILRRMGTRAGLIRTLIVAILILPLGFVFGILATSSRETALSRLFELEAVDDVRLEYMPILWEMLRDAMPWGFGFGSFESVVKVYETAGVLSPRYMNQAHNDFLQLAIEGGIPAILIAIFGGVWYLWRCLRLWISGSTNGKSHAIFFAGSLALFMGASIVDYPLRTPLAAMLLAALTAQLCFLSTSGRSSRNVRGHEA